MASGNGCDKKAMTFGMGWDAEKMLHFYICNYMKKKGLNDVADIFTQEANLDMFPLLDSDEGLLKEWWESFWPQFSSRLENKARGNSQSLTQSSMQAALALLPSPQDIPVGTPQNKVIPSHVPNQQIFGSGGSSVVNIMEQPPVSLLATTPIINQRRAGKHPVNSDTDNILGKSSAQAIRKGPVGFPSVKFLPTQLPFGVNQMVNTTPPPSADPSNLHIPATKQSPVEVTQDPRNEIVGEKSDEMESNRLK